MRQTKQNRITIKWLFRTAGKSRNAVWILALLSVVTGLITLVYAWLFRSLIDAAAEKEFKTLIGTAVLLLITLSLQIAARAVIRYLEEKGASGVENSLKLRLFELLQIKEYAAVSSVHTGEWMNRLTNDTKVVADNLIRILPGFAGMLVRLVGAVALLLILQPEFAIVLIPGGILLILLTVLFRRRLKKLHSEIQQKDGDMRVFLQEQLAGMTVLRAFGRQKASLQESDTYMRAHREARMRRNRFSNWCNIGFGTVMSGAYIASVIYCAVGIFQGTISFGTMTAVMHLVGQVQSPFAGISGVLPGYYAMLSSAERLREAEQMPEEAAFVHREKEEITAFYKTGFRGIVFRDVSFAYPERAGEKETQLFAVEHCTLRIPKGACVAFTGPSGCGKSTLLKLMMAFYRPKEGELSLDTDLGQIPLDTSWRGLFAYVPQGNDLMQGTVREAVTFGEEAFAGQEEKIRRALYTACADEFTDALPDGINTLLGEQGSGLSEGQRQRIAIARALYADRPILLLDESTSAMDEETQKELLNRLHTLTDKTILIVTHRAAVMRITDSVVRCTERNGEYTWCMDQTNN